MFFLISFLACGGNPIETCEDPPSGKGAGDCCTEHEQCAEFYGQDAPFCLYQGRPGGGLCGECRTHDDCHGGFECLEWPDGVTTCIDPTACYSTYGGGYIGDCR